MLTVITRDPRGNEQDQRWYCDPCEAAELEGRGIPPMRDGQEIVVRLGRFGSELLIHSDTVEAPWCCGCAPLLV